MAPIGKATTLGVAGERSRSAPPGSGGAGIPRRPSAGSIIGKKIGLVLAGMVVLLAACDGETSDVAGTSTSVSERSTSITDPSVPSTAPAPPPAPPASDPPTAADAPTAGSSCEDSIERVDSLGALGADCETARRVATAYDAKVIGGGTFPENAPLAVAGDWLCASKVSAESQETFDVLCDKGDPSLEAVTFTWGV